jgi:hypothetical protein
LDQAEEGVDCGGPCTPCEELNVTVYIRSRSFVQPNETFKVEAVVAANQPVRDVIVSLKLPGRIKGPTGKEMTLNFDKAGEEVISWDIFASDDAIGKTYDFSVDVSAPDGLRRTADHRLSVLEPVSISIPLVMAIVKVPSVKVIQDQTFTIANNILVIVYSQTTIYITLSILFLGFGYFYVSTHLRFRKGKGLAYV